MKTFGQKTIELPFEIGKTYKTRFQTGELFTVTNIKYRADKTIQGFEGVYEKCPHIEICPLNFDRLIPETKVIEYEIEVCECCKKPL
jgi:hypothetical protein